MPPGPARFRALFAGLAARVRRRVTTRLVLDGATVGLVVAVAIALACWRGGLARGRSLAALAGAGGALVGAFVGLRRRWSDEAVASWLDARLDGHEVVASALEVSADAPGSPAAEVLRAATLLLERPEAKRATPRVLRRWHALAPASGAALALVASAAMPPDARSAPEPGRDLVRLEHIAPLDRLAALDAGLARDPEQAARLRDLAEQARRLRDGLARGVERREALAAIARLRDGLAAERLGPGGEGARAGLEAAAARLADEETLRRAARALADRDFGALDDELERLADARERHDRDEAHRALEEAAAAASREGAAEVARELSRGREAMARREARADLLRELAEALGDGLPDEARRDLADFDAHPDDARARKLADELGRALEKLTPEERKRLADTLRRRLARGAAGDAEGSGDLRDLARRLGTPEGQQALADRLRALAAEDDASEQGRRQRALEGAEREGAAAEGALGGQPTPLPMPGGAPAGSGSPGHEPAGASAGHHEDTGTAPHVGQSAVLDAPGIAARAAGIPGRRGKADVPLGQGRVPGRAGTTARERGVGALGSTAADPVGGADRSDVPEEYREQVGRYFHP